MDPSGSATEPFPPGNTYSLTMGWIVTVNTPRRRNQRTGLTIVTP